MRLAVTARTGARPVVSLDDPMGAVRRSLEDVAGTIRLPGWAPGPLLTGGKTWRARLVLLAAGVGPRGVAARAVRSAVALELLHAAGLAHDDLVDGSPRRRGHETAWRALGPKAAVLLGTWLVAQAVSHVAAEPAAVRRALARTLRDLVRGQTDELGDAFQEEVSLRSYFRRAYAKTGALYELAGWLGAVAGGAAARERDAVAAFAAELGLAFQLADDLRDLVGGALLGREAGTDLREGVLTMPLLLTLRGRRADAAHLRRLLLAGRERNVSGAVLSLVRANGTWDDAVHTIEAHVDAAVRELRVLPASPARDVLAAAARSIVGRVDGSPQWRPGVDPGAACRRATPARSLLAIDVLSVPSTTDTAQRVRRVLGTALASAPRPLAQGATDVAVAATMIVAVADAVGTSRPEAVPRLVAVADLLLADLVTAAASLPDPAYGHFVRALDLLFRDTTEWAAADARSALVGSTAVEAFLAMIATAATWIAAGTRDAFSA